MLIIAQRKMENPENSQHCWFTMMMFQFEIFDIWKRFLGQEFLAPFGGASPREFLMTQLTSAVNAELLDRKRRAIIQNSTAETESAPKMKVPAGLTLEASLWNYC